MSIFYARNDMTITDYCRPISIIPPRLNLPDRLIQAHNIFDCNSSSRQQWLIQCMGALESDLFESALIDVIGPRLPTGKVTPVFADQPQFSGAVCLPGTHAKWVRMEAGQVQ